MHEPETRPVAFGCNGCAKRLHGVAYSIGQHDYCGVVCGEFAEATRRQAAHAEAHAAPPAPAEDRQLSLPGSVRRPLVF